MIQLFDQGRVCGGGRNSCILEHPARSNRSSTPEELGRMLRTEHDRWGPIVKSIGFTADS
jgi:hypothetical protein